MKSPLKIDVVARANADLFIKGEIPKSSLGRLVDSITDIFRPFSEARGLRADQIKLQREEVAIEIAKRARARLAIEKIEAKPVDSKILIPLIEKGSLESLSDTGMIDRWSALLANASSNNQTEPRYVQILSELNARQAELFEEVILNDWTSDDKPDRVFLDAGAIFDTPRVREFVNSLFRERRAPLSPGQVFARVSDQLNQPGCVLIDMVFFEPDDTMHSYFDRPTQKQKATSYELDLEILASLGLIKRVSIFYTSKFKQDIQIFYYHATELGVNFFKSVDRRKNAANVPR